MANVGFYPIPVIDGGALQIVNTDGTTVSLTDYIATQTFASFNSNGTISAVDLAGTITTPAQPNVTSVGTLTSLSSTGNISTTANISAVDVAGTITTVAQPNITSVGTLTSLTSTGNVVMTNLPTTDPLVVNQLWNNAGALTVSAG